MLRNKNYAKNLHIQFQNNYYLQKLSRKSFVWKIGWYSGNAFNTLKRNIFYLPTYLYTYIHISSSGCVLCFRRYWWRQNKMLRLSNFWGLFYIIFWKNTNHNAYFQYTLRASRSILVSYAIQQLNFNCFNSSICKFL